MSDVLWQIEVDRALEDYAEDREDEICIARLKALGFDMGEIRDEMAAVRGEL